MNEQETPIAPTVTYPLGTQPLPEIEKSINILVMVLGPHPRSDH